jgi:hypothetical protein
LFFYLAGNLREMKNFILSLTLLLCSIGNLKSSTNWTKEDRAILYQEYIDILNNYPNIGKDQKESIAICALNSICEKYTKSDYQSKIDIEIKRIKESTVNICAKNISIDLSNNNSSEKDKDNGLTKEALTGKWKTDVGFTIEFFTNGTFTKEFSNNFQNINRNYINNQKSSGDWILDASGTLYLMEKYEEKIITLFAPKIVPINSKSKINFQNFSRDSFKATIVEGEFCCGEMNKPLIKEFFGNKIK